MCRAITIGYFAMTRGFWPAVKTYKGPCFGCDCGIKCCQLLLKWLGPKSEIAECPSDENSLFGACTLRGYYLKGHGHKTINSVGMIWHL